MDHILKEEMCADFRKKLEEEEKAQATIEKYMRDIGVFAEYMSTCGPVSKAAMIHFKEWLLKSHAPASVNSMLAAVNSFLKWLGWYDCTVKALKIQKKAFRSEEKELTVEEYYRLLEAAKSKGKMRLYYVMQTLCSSGIRVSELPYVTVESLASRRVCVYSKGKGRTVLLPRELCSRLREYAKESGITGGSIFVTRRGKPLDRSNICREMKALSEEAGVPKEKIFPHNLRHLFATRYYEIKKDLSHLADLLGHASVNTTRIYTLISGEEQSRQVETLGLVV